jgi:hypothetical protein
MPVGLLLKRVRVKPVEATGTEFMTSKGSKPVSNDPVVAGRIMVDGGPTSNQIKALRRQVRSNCQEACHLLKYSRWVAAWRACLDDCGEVMDGIKSRHHLEMDGIKSRHHLEMNGIKSRHHLELNGIKSRHHLEMNGIKSRHHLELNGIKL